MPASRKQFHANIAASAIEPRLLEVSVDNAPVGPGGEIKAVEIFVYEVDQVNKEKLVNDPKTNKDDLICIFEVDIRYTPPSKNGPESFTLVETAFRIPKKLPDHFAGATISIKLAGPNNAIHRADVPFHTRERRKKNRPPWTPARPHQLEFGVDVKAKGHPPYSGRKRIDALETHVDSLGPVMSFLIKPPSGDFYRYASKYWRPRSDAFYVSGKVHKAGGAKLRFDGSLQMVWEFLSRQPAEPKFQEVNLITHGAIGALQIADRAKTKVRRLDAADILRFREALEVQKGTLLPNCLDRSNSRIVIRGCTVGRDLLLLRELSKLFGGVRVFAPKDRLLGYGPVGSAPTRHAKGTKRTEIPIYELVLRYYYVFLPGTHGNLASLSSNADCKAAAVHLNKEYPERSVAQFEKILSKELNDWSRNAGGKAIRDYPRYFRRRGALMELYPFSLTLNTPKKVPKSDESQLAEKYFDKLTWEPFYTNPADGQDLELVRYDITKLNRDPDPGSVPEIAWRDSAEYANEFAWERSFRKVSGPTKVKVKGENKHQYKWEATFTRTRIEAVELESDNDDLDEGEAVPLDLDKHCGTAKVD